MELHRRDGDFSGKMGPIRWDERKAICMWDENGVGVALKPRIDIGSKIL